MKTNRTRRLIQAATASLALAIPSFVSAVTYQWDANGATAGLGGVGTWVGSVWDTVGTGGDTGTDAPVTPTWTSADTAIFGGTAGAVTRSAGDITLNSITYNTTGYSLTGTSIISFAGTTPTLTTGTGITATIDSKIGGTVGFTKSGAGTAILRNTANTISGTITVSAGELQAWYNGTTAGTYTTLGTSTVTVNSATLRFKCGSTGNAMTYANAINLNGATLIGEDGVTTLTGALGLTGANTINGVYANKNVSLGGAVTGTGSINKTGPANLLLTGASNNYSGGTTLAAGNLSISNATGLGTGALNITSTTGVGLTVANNNATTVANAITLPAPGTAQTYTVTKNTASATTGTELTMSGAITGGGGNLTLRLTSGTGGDTTTTYRLSGANTFTGTVEIFRGSLVLDGADDLGQTTNTVALNSNTSSLGDLRFAAPMTLPNPISILWPSTISTQGNNATLSGVISGATATYPLTKLGTGTLTLAGANTYAGPTIVTAGTLQLDYSSNDTTKLADAAALTLVGSTTLELTSTSATVHEELVGSTTLTGAATLSRSGSSANTISLGAIGTGGSLNVTSGGFAKTSNANDVNGFLPGNITVNNAPATKDISGFIIAATGYTDVDRLGGLIADGSTNNVRIIEAGTTGPVTVDLGPITIQTITNAGTADPTTIDLVGQTLRLGATGSIFAGTNGLSIDDTTTGGALTAGGADNTAGTIEVANNSSTITTISAAITDNGTGVVGLTKSGDGDLLLGGTNTYTGTTTVNGGTLALGGSAIADTGLVTLANNTGALLGLDAAETIGSLAGGGSTGGNVDILSHTLTIADGAGQTFAGAIIGTGALVKQGSGTQTITGVNTYSGGTTVSAGTLVATVSTTQNSIGTGATNIAGGTLQLNNTNTSGSTVTISNTFTGAGVLKLNFAAGTSARNTFLNNVTGFTGTIQLSNAGANADKWATFAGTSPASLVIDSGSQYYASNASTFSGGITVSGTGNSETRGAIRLGATLGGNVILAGDTAIGSEGGTLSGTISSGAAGTQTLTVGTTNSTGNATFSGVIGGGTGTIALTKTQAGTLTLSGTNTYSGATALNGGTLNLTGSIASSALTMAAATTLSGEGSTLSLTTAGTSNLVINPNTVGAFTTGAISMGGVMTVSLSQAPVTAGSIRVLNYTGTDPLPANFALAGAASYRNPQFNASAGAVDLTLGETNLIWTAAGGTNWNVETTSNWSTTPLPTLTASTFSFADTVTFDDTPGDNQTITIAADVQPSNIIFNNSLYSYTLNRTSATVGKIVGATGITKNGTNTVTLGGADGQNFTGAIAVNQGTLKMGNRDAFGLTSGITIASGAAVDINGQGPGAVTTGGYTYNIAGDGSGTGAIVNTGANVASNAGVKTLNLNGNASIGVVAASRFDIGFANTAGTGSINGNGYTLTKKGAGEIGFRGDASASVLNVVVEAGSAWTENTANGFGGATGSLLVKNGAFGGTYGALSVSTPVTLEGGATLNNKGGGVGTWTGTVTLTGAASMDSTNNSIVVAGNVSGTSGLTVKGANSIILTAANTGYSGKVTVDTGILRIAQDTSLGAVPGALVADAITLQNGGRIQTGDAGAGLNLTINANRGITLGTGGGGFHTWGGFTTTYNGPITGSGILIKNDTGTANLGGTNDFTGGIRIDNGKLILAGTNSLGTTNGINIKGAGKTLEITSTGSVTTGTIIMGDSAGGLLIVDGSLNATSFTNSWRAGDGSTNGVTINGTMTVSGNYTYSINATTVLNGTGSLSVGSFTMANATTNVLFGTGGLSFTNAGTFAMNSTNTFTQSAGTVNNTSAVADDIRIGSGGTGVYNLNGGTYNAVNTPTTIAYGNTGTFTIAAGTTANVAGFKFGRAATTNAGTLNVNGGTVNIGTGGISDGSSAANTINVNLGTATIGARANWTGSVPMVLATGATTTFNTLDSVDLTTARTITLSGALSGSGALTKSGIGTLALNATNSYTGATVVNGGKLHVGTSLASSSVTVNSGGTVQPASLSAAGTGTVTNLDLNGGSAAFRIGTSSDQLVVSGTLTVNAPSVISGVPANAIASLPATFTVIDYTGTIGGPIGFDDLSFVPANPHLSGTLQHDEGDTKINVEITAADTITWTGATDGNWDVNATENWRLDSDDVTASKYYDFDVVTFDQVGIDNLQPTVTMVGTITPSSVTVANTGGTYTFQGTGIGGTASLAKSGAGALTLAVGNTYSGGTTLAGGTITAEAAQALGTGAVTMTGGTLNVNNAQALGSGTLTISGGTIDNTSAGPLTLTTNNVQNWNGNFTFTGTQNLNLGTGAVTMNANRQVTVNAGTLTVGGPIGGAFALTKAGSGTMVLNGANGYTGTTTVNAGTLEVSANSGAKVYSVASGATLKLGYSTGGADYNYGATINGVSVADPSGLYIEGGDSLVFQSTLTLATAPSTIRAYGTGTGTLRGWDVNGTHLTVNAAASGSVVDTNIALNGSGYGYRMNVAAGTNTAMGDLVVNGTMPGSANAGFANFRKDGTGSLLINTAATYAAGMDIRNGSVILGGNDRLPVASYVTLGFNADSGKLVLNGYSQTLASVTAIGTGTKSVVGGSSTASTLTVNNATDVTYSGKLGGAGTNENNLALVKSGAGILTLSGANTHTGNTTVNAGKLTLAATTGQLAFKLGNSAATNLVTGAGEAEFNGIFNIDTTAVTDTTGTWVLANVTTQSFTTSFAVAGFGDADLDNKWVKEEGTKVWTFDEANGTLTLAVAGGYASWAGTNAPTGTATDDFDGDGVPNGVEYVLGGDKDTNDLGKLPVPATDGTNMTFTFVRDQDSVGPDTSVEIEVGTDLITWPDSYTVGVDTAASDAGVTVTDNLDGTDTITLSVTMAPDAVKFARLHVVITE